MKFEVTSSQVGFVGKFKEHKKIEKAIELFEKKIDNWGVMTLDVEEDSNYVDISLGYDKDDYTVKELRSIWMQHKEEIMLAVKGL